MGSSTMGYTCTLRSKERIKITIAFSKKEEEYEILKEIPFDSKRRKQSILLKRVGGNSIVLMSKGADDAMMETLNCDSKQKQRINADITYFSKQGLRTLVHAWKVISQTEYFQFQIELMTIEALLDQSEKHK